MSGCCDSGDQSHAVVDQRFRSILWIALVANGLMFVVEAIASIQADSMSLQADAIDFFGDAANYAISLFVAGAVLSTRAKASLVKAASMAAFGIFVLASALYRAAVGSAPDPGTMGAIALLALVVNVAVAALLFSYRDGDSNKTSIWLCSRNDAMVNIAVMVAAAGVFSTASRWPDLFVAVGIAALSLHSAWAVLRLARAELAMSPA